MIYVYWPLLDDWAALFQNLTIEQRSFEQISNNIEVYTSGLELQAVSKKAL